MPAHLFCPASSSSSSSSPSISITFSVAYDLSSGRFTYGDGAHQQPTKSLLSEYLEEKQEFGTEKIQFIKVKFRRSGDCCAEEDETIAEILRYGFFVDEDESTSRPRLHFLHAGESNSMLKGGTYLFLPDGEQRQLFQTTASLVDCPASMAAHKKLKYCGLLHTGLLAVVDVPAGVISSDRRLKMVEDVVGGGFVFTDGCGWVSLGLARKWQQQIPELRDGDFVPSIWQVWIFLLKPVVRGYNPSLLSCL